MSWGVATQNGVSVSLASIVSLSCGATEAFSPASLFTSGVAGAWYDPSDYSTLFQDSAGTTPVTAVEQPVGLMLDKSQGLVLGSELITPVANQDFSSDTGFWQKDPGITISGGSANWVNIVNNAYSLYKLSFLTAGKYYEITYTITSISGGTLLLYLGGTTGQGRTTPGTYTERLTMGTTNNVFSVRATSVTLLNASIDNISVKELPGNHASQATSASRPILRARYNLLTYSEQFDNAAWTKGNTTVTANQTIAPDGTTTADLLYPSTSGTIRWIYQTLTAISAVYTRSVYVKAQNKSIVYIDATGAGTVAAYFNLSSGTVGTVPAGYTATITAVGSGWYRCTMTNSTAAIPSFSGIYGVADADGSTTVTANGTDGIYLWGAQFVTGSSAGTYQRIAAATDYATAGFLPYLATDGTDDTLSSGNIDLTGTSKLSAVVGATKNIDSAVYAIVDFGATGSNTAGGFSMWAGSPISGGAATWASSFQTSAGGGAFNIISPTNFAAPATGVVTTILDTVNAGSYLRVNGALQATQLADPADGTFGNLPLRLSRSGANGLPGRIYQLVVVGKTLSASELASTEAYVNSKTGAY